MNSIEDVRKRVKELSTKLDKEGWGLLEQIFIAEYLKIMCYATITLDNQAIYNDFCKKGGGEK